MGSELRDREAQTSHSREAGVRGSEWIRRGRGKPLILGGEKPRALEREREKKKLVGGVGSLNPKVRGVTK